MALSVDWLAKIVTVPQADLTALGGGVFELDLDAFRLELKSLEASEAGMPFDDIHSHNTVVTVAGTTLARVVEIINGYQVEFEDGQYAVNLKGANSNVGDAGIAVVNQVSLRSFNTAGLIQVSGGGSGDVTACHMAAAYDDTTGNETLRINAWLERAGEPVTNPTSIGITLYDIDGTVLFALTETDALVGQDPDPQGTYTFSHSLANPLVGDTTYYANVAISDPTGSVTTRRGITTVV